MVPEIAHRGAFEYSEEEENEAHGSGECHGGIENVCVNAIDRDAKKGDDDGELGDNASQNVE